MDVPQGLALINDDDNDKDQRHGDRPTAESQAGSVGNVTNQQQHGRPAATTQAGSHVAGRPAATTQAGSHVAGRWQHS